MLPGSPSRATMPLSFPAEPHRAHPPNPGRRFDRDHRCHHGYRNTTNYRSGAENRSNTGWSGRAGSLRLCSCRAGGCVAEGTHLALIQLLPTFIVCPENSSRNRELRGVSRVRTVRITADLRLARGLRCESAASRRSDNGCPGEVTPHLTGVGRQGRSLLSGALFRRPVTGHQHDSSPGGAILPGPRAKQRLFQTPSPSKENACMRPKAGVGYPCLAVCAGAGLRLPARTEDESEHSPSAVWGRTTERPCRSRPDPGDPPYGGDPTNTKTREGVLLHRHQRSQACLYRTGDLKVGRSGSIEP